MSNLNMAIQHYEWIRDRIRSEETDIDEQTLADTVEGLTDLHEIAAAVIRSALIDEAFVDGLKTRVKEMHTRLTRLEERASQRRRLVRDVMIQTGIKKIAAAEFTVSVRPGLPVLVLQDEALIPEAFWEPQPPRLSRQSLIGALKKGETIPGAELGLSEFVLSVRSK